MIWNGASLKTVFILGAGATRGAFSHVRVNGKKISAPLNGDFFKIAEAFARAHSGGEFQARYNRVRKVFREEFPTRGRWPIPMEEAFSLLFVSKDFPEIYARRGRQRKPGARREIEDFLRLTFGILSAIEVEVKPDNLYAKLASRLESGDRILTLNYDTLLDSALVTEGWNPEKGYGLIGSTKKFQWRRPRPTFSPRVAGVKLLKLHGSLNWYARGSFAQLARVFERGPSKVIISDRPRTNEFRRLIRQIIPPVYGKFFGHKHWRTLWTTAHDAVFDAEVIVVIGCSLVDTDFHLTGMLSHAVTKRKRDHNPFKIALVVDRTTVRRKWMRLLRGCAMRQMERNSFQRFAKDLLGPG
jgi:hypothetical protein